MDPVAREFFSFWPIGRSGLQSFLHICIEVSEQALLFFRKCTQKFVIGNKLLVQVAALVLFDHR